MERVNFSFTFTSEPPRKDGWQAQKAPESRWWLSRRGQDKDWAQVLVAIGVSRSASPETKNTCRVFQRKTEMYFGLTTPTPKTQPVELYRRKHSFIRLGLLR